MTLEQELTDFYHRHGFGQTPGMRPLTVRVYTGCMLVPLPNIETRYIYLKYHDLHHLVTGYSVGRIGEGEVSAWELGTGSFRVNPLLGVMNLIALSTGLVLRPARMWAAFRLGCRSRNLYPAKRRAAVDAGCWRNVDALRRYLFVAKPAGLPPALRIPEFALYAALALAVHAVIAIPAVIARTVTDVALGQSFFEAVKPVRRDDLY